MEPEDILPHVTRRLEVVETRIDKLDDRFHTAVYEEFSRLDRRVQHMEDGHIHQTEQISELKEGVQKSLTIGESILQRLDEHILTEARDRFIFMGILILGMLGTFFTTLWEHLLK
jgi:hypothetical protein